MDYVVLKSCPAVFGVAVKIQRWEKRERKITVILLAINNNFLNREISNGDTFICQISVSDGLDYWLSVLTLPKQVSISEVAI